MKINNILRTLLFVVLTTIITPKVLAQDLYFGARAGLNLSNVTSNNFSDENTTIKAKTKAGLNLGAVVGYKVTPFFAVEILPNYSFQGFKQNSIAILEDGSQKESNIIVNLDYLKIPLTVKVFLLDAIYAQSGVSFNILTSALADLEPVKNLNGFDLSIPIAVGYKLNRHIDLSLQYDISLTRFNEARPGANRNFSVNVAWIF